MTDNRVRALRSVGESPLTIAIIVVVLLGCADRSPPGSPIGDSRPYRDSRASRSFKSPALTLGHHRGLPDPRSRSRSWLC